MARPALVDIRWRNPWFLALLRLLGWYVRFTLLSSLSRSAGGHGAAAKTRRWPRCRAAEEAGWPIVCGPGGDRPGRSGPLAAPGSLVYGSRGRSAPSSEAGRKGPP